MKRVISVRRASPVRHMFLSGAAALSCAGVAPGMAQAPDEIVVVTETRAAQSLRDVTASITRIEADDIARIRAEHVSELLARAPGVFIHRGSGQEHLTAIRSPVLTGGAGAGSFLFLENGVPLRAKGFSNVNGLFEAHTELADAIEIVRGPGGVVHGSNAVHGVINVLSPAPEDDQGGGAAFSAGSFGRYKGDVWVNAARGDHALYAGFSEIFESGFRDDAGLDQQKLTLSHVYDGARMRVATVASGHNLNQETAGFVRGEDAFRDKALRRTNPNPEAFRNAKAIRLSSRVEFDAADATIALTPYGRWTEMDFLQHFLPSRALEENGHWSIGLQSALYKDYENGATLTAGVDFERTEGFLRETQSLPSFGSFPEGVHYDYEVTESNVSGYFLYKYPLAERLTLDAGLRLESTRYDYDNQGPSDIVGRFNRPPDRQDDFFTIAAKAGVNFYVTETASVFFAYKRGERAPQTTDLYRLQINQSVDEIEPETADSVEAGLRATLGPVVLDAAAYYMDKRNFFFRNADGFNVPDGRTRHVGVEVLADIALHPTLALQGNAAYGRHSYRFDDIVGRSSEVITSGNDVDTAPRWLTNARLVWTPAPAMRGEFEWVRVGDYFTDAANDNAYPGHDLFNLRLSWTARDNIDLFAAVRNLSNTLYAERADFAFGSERFFPGEERAFSGGVRARF